MQIEISNGFQVSLEFPDDYIWEPLNPTSFNTEYELCPPVQHALFPDGIRNFNHIHPHPVQLISTEVTRIQDCVQSTTRYHHIRDLVLENLNIICAHNTVDGKDILKHIKGWTKQICAHDGLHIPDIPQSSSVTEIHVKFFIIFTKNNLTCFITI